jgi:uncharacterized OB-fold protein
MSEKYIKPLPELDKINRPYWEAAKLHKLVLQRCQQCGNYRFPPVEICPYCHSSQMDWMRASEYGKVYTWTVIHQAFHLAFTGEVPYAVVAVELEEGPRLITNLVNCKLEEIQVDMPVEVVFRDVTEEITLIFFQPTKRNQ